MDSPIECNLWAICLLASALEADWGGKMSEGRNTAQQLPDHPGGDGQKQKFPEILALRFSLSEDA
jgi:hypothetical protein